MSAEDMAEAMYPESEMTYGYQAVREAFEYGYAAGQTGQPAPAAPATVQPTVKRVADLMRSWGVRSMHGEWTDAEAQRSAARDVLVLFAQQPTVAEVKAEALREAALAIGHSDNCWPDMDRDPYVGCRCRMSLVWSYADRIEREARP